MQGLGLLYAAVVAQLEDLGKSLHHGSSSNNVLLRMYIEYPTFALLDLAADVYHLHSLAAAAGPDPENRMCGHAHALS